MRDVQLQRDRPPTTWGEESTIARDVTEVDAAVGIYVMPSLDPDTDHPAVWHWCPTQECWLVSGTRGHTLVAREPLHLEPSLLFHCCGLHGWIRDGQWVTA